MARNEYNNMVELIKDYYDVPVGTYLNQSISINSVTLACDIYRVEPETVLTSSVFTGCTAVDANTQIVIGKNMSVASGTTLTPPYRCKGIVIGDVGTFTNEGTISMTARGASGEGKNIQLTSDYMISAVGGSGAASVSHYVNYNNTGFDGDNGSSPSDGILSCGGGGSGSVSGSGSHTRYTGAGGNGTSFSGGAGGGACTSDDTTTGYSGSSTGGAGGNGIGSGSRGGAGNPKGTDGVVVSPDTNGEGTGGLLVVLANSLISSGNLESKGSTAPGFTNPDVTRSDNAGGGASGGGCIVLISRINNITGTASVAGGSRSSITGSWINRGGAGGAGVYASYIVEDLILQNLPVEIAISDTNHLDNIEPSEGVRLLGMMDDDELYYEIMGTRHRAMNTEGALDFSQIKAPGTAGQVDGHIYSTDETVVGKWIDGKTLYEKTIIYNFTSPQITSRFWTILFNESNSYDKCWIDYSASFFMYINQDGYHFNDFSEVYSSDTVLAPAVTTQNGIVNIQILSNGNTVLASNDGQFIITIKYTKTTDTV